MLDTSSPGFSRADHDHLFEVSPSVTAAQQTAIYPQSVASGDPRSNGIVLWTRVDPTQQASPSADAVAWQIGTDPGFTPATVLLEGVAAIANDKDGTVKIAIADAALGAFTQFYYRFLYNQVPSRVGRFKTLPLPTDSLAELRFGYVVCQDYGNGYYNALTYLAEEQVDYVIHLGDYIYETIDSGSFQNNPVRTVPPFPSGGQVRRTSTTTGIFTRSIVPTQANRLCTKTLPISCSGMITSLQMIAIRTSVPITTLRPLLQRRRNRHFASPPIRPGASTG